MDDSRSATLHEEKSSRPVSVDGEKNVLPSRASAVEEKEAEAEVTTSPRPSVNDKSGHHQESDVTEMGGHDLSKIKTSETGVEYPHGVKLGLITLALCLSVFLMALVRVQGLLLYQTILTLRRTTRSSPLLFQRLPTNLIVFQMLAGTGVVRFTFFFLLPSFLAGHWVLPVPNRTYSISSHHCCVPASLWKILFLFLNQVRLPDCYRNFRTRIPHLWCRAHFNRSHRWPCRRWTRKCRSILGSSYHRSLLSASPPTAHVQWLYWSHVRNCQCCRPSSRRRLYRQGNLEMVFLY